MISQSQWTALEHVVSTLPNVISSSVEMASERIQVQLVSTVQTPAIDYRHLIFKSLGNALPLTVFVVSEIAEIDSALENTLPIQCCSSFVAPTTESERLVSEAVSTAVELEYVSVDDDLFDLNADSLVLIELATVLSEHSGTQIDIQEIFEAGTIREIARYINSELPS